MSINTTNNKNFATIGVIGGFGPQAGAVFAEQVFDEFAREGAKATPDFPRLILINVQTEPVFGGSEGGFVNREKTLADIGDAIEELERAGADLIAIPCNSLFAVYRELEKLASVPILHIADSVVREACEQGLKRLLLLGTGTTLDPKNDVYYSRCAKTDIELIVPSRKHQREISDVVQKVFQNKAGEAEQNSIARMIEAYRKGNRIDGVILGCTELSLINIQKNIVPVLDSLNIYAAMVAEYSRGAIKHYAYDEGALYSEMNLLERFIKSEKPPVISDYFLTDDRFVKSLNDCGTVLDIGCGWGRHLELMSGSFQFGIGIDNDERIIRKTKEHPHHQRLRFAVADAYALPFPNSFFDTVVCLNNTFGNLYKHRRALREMIRVAKPGARIAISVHGLELVKDKIEWYQTVGLTNPVFREDLNAVVTDEGFYSYCFEKKDLEELLQKFPVDFTIKRLTSASWLCEVMKR